jgi:hypothetical protein
MRNIHQAIDDRSMNRAHKQTVSVKVVGQGSHHTQHGSERRETDLLLLLAITV